MASVSLTATGKASFDEMQKQLDANDGDAWIAARATTRVVGHNIGKAVAVAAAAAACGAAGSVVPVVGTALGALACGYLAGVLADLMDSVIGPFVDDAVDAIGEFFGFTSEPPPPSHIYVIPGVGTVDFALSNSILLLQRTHKRMGLPGPYSTLDVLRRLKQGGEVEFTARSTRDTTLGRNSYDFSDSGDCTWTVPRDLVKSAVSVTACKRPLPEAHALPSAVQWAPNFERQFEASRWRGAPPAASMRANLRHAEENKRRYQSKGRTSAKYDGTDAVTWRWASQFRNTVMRRWLEALRRAYAKELLSLQTMATALAAEKAMEAMMDRLTRGLSPFQQGVAVACFRQKLAAREGEGLGSIASAVRAAARGVSRGVAEASRREQVMTRIIQECRAVALRPAPTLRRDLPPSLLRARAAAAAAAAPPPTEAAVAAAAPPPDADSSSVAVRRSARERALLERMRGKRPTTMKDLEQVEATAKGVDSRLIWLGVAVAAGGYLLYRRYGNR
jgi:hypothetical protein